MAEKKYIPIIDYLKAFAIMLVTTTHFFTYNDKDSDCRKRSPEGGLFLV